MSTKRILWISQFAPLGVQVWALQGMFGADCEVVHRNISSAQEVAREYNQGGYSDIVCVVPLTTLDHICRQGLKPLWSDMVEAPPPDKRVPDLEFRGRRMWFAGYRRVLEVTLDLEPVEPRSGVNKILRVTRHPIAGGELAAFQAAFGPQVQFVENPQPFRDGADIIDRMRRLGADEVLVVAPYSVYDQMVRAGVKPLYAKMVEIGHHGWTFKSLHRVVGITVRFA
jgi:hypothetical protein